MPFLNRCVWTAVSAGTADFVVSAAVPGCYAPAGCANPAAINGPYHYVAYDSSNNHEESEGIWNSGTNTLARSAGNVRDGTNGAGALVSFASAPTVIMGGPIANDLIIPAVSPQLINFQDPSPEDTPFPSPPIIASGSIQRMALGADAKNWTFLGTTGSSSGVTVGPIVWSGQFQQIYFEYNIAGYSGGTPAGRLLMGAASISTTGATNGNGLMENTTNGNTSVSVPGCPLGIALTANLPRSGRGWISGPSGSFKTMDIIGKSGTVAVATSPVAFQAASYFSDLSTNLLIQRLQLSVYDTLTATALSANSFTSGTQLSAWGRNND